MSHKDKATGSDLKHILHFSAKDIKASYTRIELEEELKILNNSPPLNRQVNKESYETWSKDMYAKYVQKVRQRLTQLNTNFMRDRLHILCSAYNHKKKT